MTDTIIKSNQYKPRIFFGKLNGNDKLEKPDCAKIKRQVIKNLLVLCFAWTSLFTSWQSIANLQSSINMEEGLGTASLAVVFAGVVISSFFQLPPLLIERLGCKWTLVLAMIGYISYFVSNYLPNWPSLLSGSAAIGFAGGFLWAAKCTYLSQLSSIYARANGENAEVVLSRFFGIFYSFFLSCQVWGNLISSVALSEYDAKSNSSSNSSHAMELCGIHFCPHYGHFSENLERPSNEKIFNLITIYVFLAIICFVMFLSLLDSITMGEKSKLKGKQFCLNTMIPILKQGISPKQLLLIPLTVFIGIQQTFIAAEFTMAYVACNFGINMVGYTMIAYGTSGGLVSIFIGFLPSKIDHSYLMAIGGFIHLVTILTLLLWTNMPHNLVIYFCISAFWGLGEIWQIQLNTIYGSVFRRNISAAYTNMMLWKSIGFIIGFSYSHLLCIYSKCSIMLGFLLVSALCYAILEFLHRKSTAKYQTELKEIQHLNAIDVET